MSYFIPPIHGLHPFGASYTSLYLYDRMGRRIETIDPDAGTIDYRYNALGELIEQTTPRLYAAGQKLAMTYDKLGRPTSRVEPAIDGAGNISTTDTLTTIWTYDDIAGGNLALGKLSGFSREEIRNRV